VVHNKANTLYEDEMSTLLVINEILGSTTHAVPRLMRRGAKTNTPNGLDRRNKQVTML
jgi:hypothetical protein